MDFAEQPTRIRLHVKSLSVQAAELRESRGVRWSCSLCGRSLASGLIMKFSGGRSALGHPFESVTSSALHIQIVYPTFWTQWVEVFLAIVRVRQHFRWKRMPYALRLQG